MTRTVCLVHGAWHGAWCWASLQAELDQRGVPSLAVDLPGHGASLAPLGDLHGDADHVVHLLDRLGGDVVLVGHSYGGAVVTEVATRRPEAVAHLVYLTAFALAPGESVLGLLGMLPRQEVALAAAMVPGEDGTTRLDPERAPQALYGCCPPGAVAAAVARLDRQPMATFTQAVSGSPWSTIPTTYVVCTRDEAVHPAHQEHLAQRCQAAGGSVVRLDTDHSPFLSAPGSVADLLETVAAG